MVLPDCQPVKYLTHAKSIPTYHFGVQKLLIIFAIYILICFWVCILAFQVTLQTRSVDLILLILNHTTLEEDVNCEC